jgi:hypothetical protein
MLIGAVQLSNALAVDFRRRRPTPLASKEHGMPNRSDLADPALRTRLSDSTHQDIFPVISFCLIGLLASVSLALGSQHLDQISLFILQYNGW